MKPVRIGINGMGRIGRTLLRLWYNRIERGELPDFEIVAANNPGKPDIYAHLLKYDSCHGTFKPEVAVEGDMIRMGNKSFKAFSERDPANIPWSDQNVDIVIDSSGRFRDMESLGKHLGGTVKKVILCAPGKDLDGTFVVGINHKDYDPSKHNIFSNASCTTNCLAPVAKVLEDKFGIESGFMTTIHAYTQDQSLLDASHKDIRRSRAAAMSIIPTTTGAAKALGEVIPSLKGKLDGYALRVPTPDVSMVDLTAVLKKEVSIEEINAAVKEASEGEMKGVLGYTEEELVSIDFKGLPESSIFDSKLTNVTCGKTVKVVTWYDNEVGFSERVLDLAAYVQGQM